VSVVSGPVVGYVHSYLPAAWVHNQLVSSEWAAGLARARCFGDRTDDDLGDTLA
jgi:hypothetical protein